MKVLNTTGLKLAAISLLAIALAVVVSVFVKPAALSHASPGLADEGCNACHTSAIICDDCTQCHAPATIYYLGRTIGMDHHDLSSGAAISPATTTLDSCVVSECHNDASDARYVTSRDSNHTYCGSSGCHDTGPGPSCDSGLCHTPGPG